MFVVSIFLLVYLLFIMPRMFNKPDISVLKGYHYAHRGLFNNNGDAPENSLLAFQKAIDKGLLNKATNNAKTIISNFVKSYVEGYKIEIED